MHRLQVHVPNTHDTVSFFCTVCYSVDWTYIGAYSHSYYGSHYRTDFKSCTSTHWGSDSLPHFGTYNSTEWCPLS